MTILQRGATTLIVSTSFALLAHQADAACARSNLSGRWDAYSVGAGDAAYWARCTLRFNAQGGIRSGTCTTDAGEQSSVSGSATVGQNCIINGSFDEESGGFVTECTIRATLAVNKQIASGVGRCDDGSIFLFNLVKR